MALDLAELLAPDHTAVVTMELQRGVVGDLSSLPDLGAAAAARGIVPSAATLVAAARAAGVQVVHCTFEQRADRAGSSENAPMLRALARGSVGLLAGSPAVEIVPELALDAADVIVPRHHGLTPFPGTELDQTLRNLGVRTIVAAGVSLNVGVAGLVMGAVDRGYQVVVATDAVVGIPPEYGDAVLANSLAALATRRSVSEITEVWAR
jgi:nicotinamidase-related amidase